jgi:Predicted nucleotide-binding protein containing TIR-like domain
MPMAFPPRDCGRHRTASHLRPTRPAPRRFYSSARGSLSEDDPLEGTSGGAAPRDNVVFEAGYFMSAKGPERCLIVRHGEAKMPADVGGAIYVPLSKTADVSSIEGRLSDFVAQNLQ